MPSLMGMMGNCLISNSDLRAAKHFLEEFVSRDRRTEIYITKEREPDDGHWMEFRVRIPARTWDLKVEELLKERMAASNTNPIYPPGA